MRLTEANNRCGNVHPASEIVSMYIDGLDESIKEVVGCYRRMNRNATFLEIVHFAKEEGNSVRARARPSKRVKIDTRGGSPNKSWTIHPRTRSIGMLQSPSESRESRTQKGRGDLDGLHLLDS